ncbi:hypothetical protein [Pseudomonas sp. FW300-N2A2]|uniref:hypothetical protein n=1 Tax=Pseudomonas sp. FW300-N2A2 TaxID=2751316 RepID=UPI001A922A7D|nr:hypothetical protein [Pseudomonas sp. FW300-N2A2]
MPLQQKTSSLIPTVTAAPDEVRMRSFNVGHGDCTLVEVVAEDRVVFRCLLDAGMALPPALITHLKNTPRTDRKPDIDVLVLSHVDADHQGGIPELLASGISIGEYLGPCLPTFKRLKWLFAPRVSEAVSRALAVEEQLKSQHIPISYPLEGFKTRYANGRIVLSIISPAAKLMKSLTLASAANLSALLRRRPLPLQWLLEAEEEQGSDEQQNLANLFNGGVVLSPEDFEEHLPSLDLPHREALTQAAEATQSEFEPEFFGNSILNDTSLVVVLDVTLDGHHRKRLVFPGDQENWTYIAAQHPAGLGIDVLKAPHHGGRVYLNDHCENFHTLYAWLRPKTVVVSANGRHHLPRTGFRDALRAVGGSLLCPNVRTFEPLSAGAMLHPEEKSCFAAMGCTPSQKPFVAITLTAKAESADVPACVQGTGLSGLAPIVVLRQEVTVPSEGLLRYTYGELDRHARWIKHQLKRRRKEFAECMAGTVEAYDVTAEHSTTPWSSLAVEAKAEGRHDLVADPEPVLKFGRSHYAFWTDLTSRSNQVHLACVPTAAELRTAIKWLKSIPMMLLIVERPQRFAAGTDRIDILQSVDWRVFDHLIAGKLALPHQVIAQEVRPKLLTIMAQHFSFQICQFDYPFNPYDGGKAYLLLQTDSAIPDLESKEWMAIWDWRASGKKLQAPWTELAKRAQNELLAGNFFDRPQIDRHDFTAAFSSILFPKHLPFLDRIKEVAWVHY